jgi:uncharacterized protein YdhG (YjbR/CyaY superfamily)
MAAKRDTSKSVEDTTPGSGESARFTDEERAAMQERAGELKRTAQRGRRSSKADGERDVLEKIAELQGDDRALAEHVHALVRASAPGLSPRTWYGMPAYANAEGKVVCFFQAAGKFKSRYATLGFNDAANLDDGTMWPTAFALTEMTPAVEERIAALVQRAAS